MIAYGGNMRSSSDDQEEPGTGALSRAIAAAVAGHDPKDTAVVALARRYGNEIDGAVRCVECGGHKGADLAKLGPALLAALEALQLSPRARKVIKDVQPATADRLDQLADRRRRRGRPESVDPAAP